MIGRARDCTTEVDYFSLFLTDDILNKIVMLTNKSIDRWYENLSPESLSKITMSDKYGFIDYTNLVEMKALFGLFYARGLFKVNYWDYKVNLLLCQSQFF